MNSIMILSPLMRVLFPLIFSVGIIVIAYVFRNKLFSKRYYKSFWISVAVFFVIYGLVLSLIAYEDYSAGVELYKFDLDKNGHFTSEERSAKGYDEAERNYISDMPLKILIPFIGGVAGSMVSIPILIIGLLIEKIKKNSAKFL